jgi:hypothetical protein
VSPPQIDRTLGEYLARNGIPQLAVSETQKFGHVTYFWNGNRSGKFDAALETYIEIPSDRVAFDQRPWMKAAEITDSLIAELDAGKARHARLNFANGDMVGHTGKRDAAVMAVEAVDLCLSRILPVIERQRGAIIVTADHGNADEMFELDSKKQYKLDARGRRAAKTSHTLNAVPFYVYAPSVELSIDSTITFREISVAITGKHYFSDSRLRPAIGLGLWSLSAWTEDGSGSVLIARLPLSADWNVSGGHAFGVEVGLNRGLAVNRLDPEDDTPVRTAIVPFPGLYYRHGWEP